MIFKFKECALFFGPNLVLARTFLDPTGSLAFTLLVGWLVVVILLNCKLIDLYT